MRGLFLLYITATLLALGLSATVDLNQGNDVIDKSLQDEWGLNDDYGRDEELIEDHDDESFEDTDDEDGEDVFDSDTELDGFKFKDLSMDELHELFLGEDRLAMAELDIEVAAETYKSRRARHQNEVTGRKKRWVSLGARLFAGAARALFRASRAGRISTSGSRITRQYARSGDYSRAVRDFNRFNPQNVRSFNGRISGRTGTVGRHRFTVRDGSSNGRPTLEIRSPRGQGTFVRKFRYGN